jgi:hypothetical protein
MAEKGNNEMIQQRSGWERPTSSPPNYELARETFAYFELMNLVVVCRLPIAPCPIAAALSAVLV